MDKITKTIGAWLWVLFVYVASYGIRWIATWGKPELPDVMFTFVIIMAYLHFSRELEEL
jgi:hypothetical protein